MATTDLSQSLTSLWKTATEIEQSLPTDGLDAVEGRRFLLRMLASSVETCVEQGDVDRPSFHHAESPIRKMFADCPDTDYLRAPIRVGPGRVYRLHGRVPEGTLYVGLLLYGKGGRIGNRLTERDLDIVDGRFELRIATEQQPGTWLRADGDETAVLVRQYFGDRGREETIAVEIELLGETQPPAPLAPDELTGNIRRAERMLEAIFKRTQMAYQMATSTAVNTFIQIPGEGLFPTPDNTYAVAWFRKAEGKQLRVRGLLPRARYFSVALYNAWLESLDYRRHAISLNHSQLHVQQDGTFEIVLSDQNPGGGNWLDTAGHQQGYVLVRALLLEGDMPAFEIFAP